MVGVVRIFSVMMVDLMWYRFAPRSGRADRGRRAQAGQGAEGAIPTSRSV
jgi:hypothetical protein